MRVKFCAGVWGFDFSARLRLHYLALWRDCGRAFRTYALRHPRMQQVARFGSSSAGFLLFLRRALPSCLLRKNRKPSKFPTASLRRLKRGASTSSPLACASLCAILPLSAATIWSLRIREPDCRDGEDGKAALLPPALISYSVISCARSFAGLPPVSSSDGVRSSAEVDGAPDWVRIA